MWPSRNRSGKSNPGIHEIRECRRGKPFQFFSACFAYFAVAALLVCLKAVTELVEEPRAQVQNYLKATGFKLGLLVNFGHYPKVQLERIVAERGRYRFGDK